MESSASEALIIGMNVFVFVIALTCGVMLMTTVLDMSQAANEIMTTSDSSLLELYGNVEERIYTGYEILTIAQKYTSNTIIVATGGGNSQEFNTSGMSNNIALFIKDEVDFIRTIEIYRIPYEKLNKKYTLRFNGKCETTKGCTDEQIGKMMYIFEEVI